MDIDLDDSHLYRKELPRTDFLYQAIVDTLRSSKLSDSAKSRTIANSVIYLYTTSGCEPHEVLWPFATVVVHMIWQIPHDHVWQDILADAVINLRKRSMPKTKLCEDSEPCMDWEDLWDLRVFIVDMRQDPIACLGEKAPRDMIIRYQRLTSFTARLTGAGYKQWWIFWPIYELSYVLGTPHEKDEVGFDCRLWSANEWLLHSADATYIALCEWEKDRVEGSVENWKRLKPTGSALQKWRAWRQQLKELEEQWHQWEFKDTTLERIRQAIKEMETVEEHQAKIKEEQSGPNVLVE